jgi:hypothetical protein
MGDFVATAGLEESSMAAYSLNGGRTWLTIDAGTCAVRDIALTSFAILIACRDSPALWVPLREMVF